MFLFFVCWIWVVGAVGLTAPVATVEAEKEVVQPAVAVEETVR